MAQVTPEEIVSIDFSSSRGATGYDETEVDQFLDDIIYALRGDTFHPAMAQNVTFSSARGFGRGGYAKDEVDAFVARITRLPAGRWADPAASSPKPAEPTDDEPLGLIARIFGRR